MIIAPSLLAANFGRLQSEVQRARRAGASWLHLDIMDGHFVPNLSFGPDVVKMARKAAPRLFLDVHLMCSRPEILLEPFAQAGADSITVHVELDNKVDELIWKIRSLGKKVGLAINPPTSMSHLKKYLKRIDLLLIMTVNPGYGGQSFIRECLTKIQQAQSWREAGGHSYRIQVDGGINYDTAAECAAAGADTFVSGTGLYRKPNMKAAFIKMNRMVAASANKGLLMAAA